MLTDQHKQLVIQLNNLQYLPEEAQSLNTSLQKADVLTELSSIAKAPVEKEYFLMQAISLLEAMSISSQEQTPASAANNEADSITTNTEHIDNNLLIKIKVQLALCYVTLANIKNEPKFYNIAKKLIKPFSSQHNTMVLTALIEICAYKNEPALCQFYINKLMALPNANMQKILTIAPLQQFKNEPWFHAMLSAKVSPLNQNSANI